jgi:hypothetical protein
VEWLELKSKALAVIAAAGLSLFPHGSFPCGGQVADRSRNSAAMRRSAWTRRAKMIDAKTKDANLL